MMQQQEPIVVQIVARKGGKTQAMIESILTQANERGVSLEVVYPQGASSDHHVDHHDDERAIFDAIADRLGEHSQATNYEVADSGEYETKLRGPVDVEVLAEWLLPTVLAFRRTEVPEPSAEECRNNFCTRGATMCGTCSWRKDPEPQGEPSNVSEPDVSDISPEQMSVSVHTPADDEREALSEFLFTVYDHGTQPNALREADAILSFLRHRTAQGEPSDAQVFAALSTLMPEVDWYAEAMREANPAWIANMRAALRAAAAVQGGDHHGNA